MENYTPIQTIAQNASYQANKSKAYTLYDEKTAAQSRPLYLTWAICIVTGAIPFVLFYVTILFEQYFAKGTLGIDFIKVIMNGLPLAVGAAFVYGIAMFIITKDFVETLFTMLYLVIGYVILGYLLHLIGIYA